MIVAESGKVTNTVVRLREEYDPRQLELLSKVMTHNYKGKLLTSLLTLDIIEDVEKDIAALGKLAGDIVPFIYAGEYAGCGSLHRRAG